MARRQVVEIICDRCDKVETQLATVARDEGEEFELEVTLHGQSVKYEDLCQRCRRAVVRYFSSMTKQPDLEEGKTPQEKIKKVEFLGGSRAG